MVPSKELTSFQVVAWLGGAYGLDDRSRAPVDYLFTLCPGTSSYAYAAQVFVLLGFVRPKRRLLRL